MATVSEKQDALRITYCPFEDKRLDETLDLMVQSFAAGENTTFLLRGCQDGSPEDHRGWIGQCLRLHDRRVCRLAIDEASDRVVGVCASDIIVPGSPNPMAPLKTAGRAARLLGEFLDQVEEDYDIFKALGVEKALYINLVTVDKRYRRRGISYEMRRQSVELGREAGCQAAVDFATSPFTRRALTKLGFHPERFLPFRESMLTGIEEVDLSGCGPDDGCALMVCRL